MSNDAAELKSMPVRKSHTEVDKYEAQFNRVIDQISEEGMPYNAQDLLLEALEEEAKKIRNDLNDLVSRIEKFRRLKNPDA